MMNINQNSRMKDRNQGDWARLGMNYDINDNFSFEVSTNGTLFNKRIPGSTDTYIQNPAVLSTPLFIPKARLIPNNGPFPAAFF